METVESFLAARFPEVAPLDFYRDLFGSGNLDVRGAFTKGRFCAIAVQVHQEGNGTVRARRFTVCDDLEPLPQLVSSDDFVVVSPVAYCGKSQRQEMARELYALAFDLDGLIVRDGRQQGLRQLLYDFDELKRLPKPTYLVSSGNGIHCYYMLEAPLRLYPTTFEHLRAFRGAMVRALWDSYVTELSASPQYESCTQSFRAVGSVGKDKTKRVKAYKIGDKTTIPELNSWIDVAIAKETKRSEIERLSNLKIPTGYESDLPLSKARELYPEWYERVAAGKPRGTWKCNRALYDWYKREVVDGANQFPAKDRGVVQGHRYFGIMCLAVYARKCGISREELENDAYGFISLLDARTTSEDNHFDVADVTHALEAYNDSYITVPRRTIEQLTNLDIPPNKRNGRKQSVHLAICRSTKAILNQAGEGHAANAGRPSKKDLVSSYYQEHPNTTVRQCAAELGISTRTAQKWIHALREQEQR